ncbi:hypothetical protein [Cellulomonas hominis]
MAAPPPVLPRLPVADPGLRTRHLLGLPDGVVPEEIEVLAVSRFPAARWEVPPRIATGRRAGRDRARVPDPTPGVLRLGRLTTVTGPYAVELPDSLGLGLPAGTRIVYDVACPRERGAAPHPGGDRDGLKRAFPAGMPVREEERVLHWLVAVARRLGGSVRTGERGVVLHPDVDAVIDLTVFADRWLEPEQALAVVQRVAPRARLAGAPVPPAPAPAADTAALALREILAAHGVADERERRRLHAEADAYDALMRERPPAPTGFGVLVDLGVDGLIAVEVAAETELPAILRGLDWTAGEVVAYRVRWEPEDVEELESERPSIGHRVARGRAAPRVQAVVRALHAEVGREIADPADFLVDPAEL